MVDARLPAEWLGSIRIDDLSDRAFRTLAGALMWCNGQGTDGAVPARYTKYLHPEGDDQAAFDELERGGFWTRNADGYLLTGWSSELRQSTAEEVARYKDGARLRQKAYRERRRNEDASPAAIAAPARVTRRVAHDVTRDVTANVGSGSSGEVGNEESLRHASRHGSSDLAVLRKASNRDDQALRRVRPRESGAGGAAGHASGARVGLPRRRPQARPGWDVRGVRFPTRPSGCLI